MDVPNNDEEMEVALRKIYGRALKVSGPEVLERMEREAKELLAAYRAKQRGEAQRPSQRPGDAVTTEFDSLGRARSRTRNIFDETSSIPMEGP